MAKHKTKEEWIDLFIKYENDDWDWNDYYENHVDFSNEVSKARGRNRNKATKLSCARGRFKTKYKQWKLLDNMFMIKTKDNRGRKPKRDIDEVISNLTEQEKEDILKRYFEIVEEEKKKKEEANRFDWANSRKGYIFGMHRSTFSKKPKQRIYKFDIHKEVIIDTFEENYKRYGSVRLSEALKIKGVSISDRTLRDYMRRWGLITITRQARRVGEVKFKDKVEDLVQRDFHGQRQNIKATDVSYIPADETQNFIYLSATIDHRTKFVHWYLSKTNDMDLVMRTQVQIDETDYILHSDHAWQYFNKELLDFNSERNIKTSMKATRDPLDNREIEYFFGCIKTECLHKINTGRMKFDEIKGIISEYIEWYNTKRIQKRLQWKTPAVASAYAV